MSVHRISDDFAESAVVSRLTDSGEVSSTVSSRIGFGAALAHEPFEPVSSRSAEVAGLAVTLDGAECFVALPGNPRSGLVLVSLASVDTTAVATFKGAADTGAGDLTHPIVAGLTLGEGTFMGVDFAPVPIPGALDLGRESFVAEFVVLVPEPPIQFVKTSLAVDAGQGVGVFRGERMVFSGVNVCRAGRALGREHSSQTSVLGWLE
jgi:hypothetical protein